MAACSHLRSVGAPFAADDALWAYTMGGLAALRGGTPAATAAGLFERFDAAVADGTAVDVRGMARAEARRLELRDAAPLERELGGGGPAAPSNLAASSDPVAAPSDPAGR